MNEVHHRVFALFNFARDEVHNFPSVSMNS